MNTYIYCTSELKDMLQVSLYSMERSGNGQFLENLHIGTDRDSYDCISKAVEYPVECFDAIDLPCDSDFSHKSMAGKVQLVEKYGSGLIIDADTLFIKHIEFPKNLLRKLVEYKIVVTLPEVILKEYGLLSIVMLDSSMLLKVLM